MSCREKENLQWDAYLQLLKGAKSYAFTIANQNRLERQLMIQFTEKHSLARFFF